MSAAPTPEEAPTRTCAVCRRPFGRGKLRTADATCSPACADAYRVAHAGELTVALILATLARPVAIRPPTAAGEPPRTVAYLCLDPLPPAALACRRDALRHARPRPRERSGRPPPARGDVDTERPSRAPEEPNAMSERAQDKPNKGQDEKTHEFVNDATGETRTETQRWFRSEGRDAGFRRAEDTDAAAEAESAEGE